MVGIVIVSHSQKLAEGVVELAKMVADTVPIAAAGGLDDGGLGTSYAKIDAAIDSVMSDDGVAILMDLGSAVMTAEMVLENRAEKNIRLIDCPLVEGAMTLAAESSLGTPLDELENMAGDVRQMCKL